MYTVGTSPALYVGAYASHTCPTRAKDIPEPFRASSLVDQPPQHPVAAPRLAVLSAGGFVARRLRSAKARYWLLWVLKATGLWRETHSSNGGTPFKYGVQTRAPAGSDEIHRSDSRKDTAPNVDVVGFPSMVRSLFGVAVIGNMLMEISSPRAPLDVICPWC